jgi:hypothetical protein
MKTKKAVKKNGVAKNTYNAKVEKFATEFDKALDDLFQFVESHCRGDLGDKSAALESLTEIVDRYINLNAEVQAWCYKRRVNHRKFVNDITKKGLEFL